MHERFGCTARAAWILLAAALLSSAAGCGSEKKDPGGAESSARGGKEREFAQMQFDVDPALLGNTYADTTLMLRFAPPRGWPPLDPTLMEAAKEILEKNLPAVEKFSTRPHRIFYNPEKQLFMIISRFPNWPMAVDPYVAFVEYRDAVQRRVPGVEMRDTFYRSGKLDIYQILLTNPVMVNFRLMFIRENQTPIQVDYLLPRVAYEEMVKGIEASIGSFEPFVPGR
jgi:hypothetical protein